MYLYLKKLLRDFSVDTVDRNPPAKAGDTGSNLGRGRFRMLQNCQACVLSLWAATRLCAQWERLCATPETWGSQLYKYIVLKKTCWAVATLVRLSESFLLPMSPGRINPTADNLEVTTCGKDPREVWGHTTQEAVGLRLEGKDVYCYWYWCLKASAQTQEAYFLPPSPRPLHLEGCPFQTVSQTQGKYDL